MTEVSLGLQESIRAILIANLPLTAMVAPEAIFDRSARPEIFPCIIIGDGQTILEDSQYDRRVIRVYSEIHCWTNEGDLSSVKIISGAVQEALRGAVLTLQDHSVVDFKIASTRFLRDPGGQHAHAVIGAEALLQEFAS